MKTESRSILDFRVIYDLRLSVSDGVNVHVNGARKTTVLDCVPDCSLLSRNISARRSGHHRTDSDIDNHGSFTCRTLIHRQGRLM